MLKEVWKRKWLKRRTEREVYRQLSEELRLKEHKNRITEQNMHKNIRTEATSFVRYFGAKKLHPPLLLSRNLSQNTSCSVDLG